MSAANPSSDATSTLERARAAVTATPDDPAALRAMAQASATLNLPDATSWYEKLVAVAPDDAEAWRDLADELVSDGDEERASRALKRLLELVPNDANALANLAHLEHHAGRSEAAFDLLGQAAETTPFDKNLLRTLIDFHLDRGQTESALSRAEELSGANTDDVVVLLDIAELALGMGDHTKAARTFDRLLRIDDADGHLVYAYHGIIEAEVLAKRWRPALNAALEAAAADRLEFTTDLLLFVSAQLFGVTDEAREPKPWTELSDGLARERAEHRRYHIEQAIL